MSTLDDAVASALTTTALRWHDQLHVLCVSLTEAYARQRYYEQSAVNVPRWTTLTPQTRETYRHQARKRVDAELLIARVDQPLPPTAD